MSPDKQAIADKICTVLEKLGLSPELVALVKSELADEGTESENGTEEGDTMQMGVPAKKATVVVVKKDNGAQSMTDMLKGF